MKIINLAFFLLLAFFEQIQNRSVLFKAYLKPFSILEQVKEKDGTKSSIKDDIIWSCLFYCGKTDSTIKDSVCPSTAITLTLPQDLKFENDQSVLARCSDPNSDEYQMATEFCFENGKHCSSPNPANIVVLGQ